MSYGLRVWNASGVQTLDVTDRISRIVSSHSFSVYFAGTPNAVLRSQSVSVTVPGMVNDGTWLVGGLNVTAGGTPTQKSCIPYIVSGRVDFTVYYGGSASKTLTVNFDVMRA